MDTNVKIKPGFVILDTTSVRGGVHRRRKEVESHSINGGDGLDETHEIRKIVDNVSAVEAAEDIGKAVDYWIRKNTIRTVMGPFCTPENLETLKEGMARFKAQESIVNANSAAVGSACRVYVGCVPVAIDVVSPEAVLEVSRSVCIVLEELSGAIKAGDIGSRFDGIWQKTRGLANLAVGIQSDSIVWALDELKAARKEVKRRIKEMSQDPATAGSDIELPMTGSAIASFTNTTSSEEEKAALESAE